MDKLRPYLRFSLPLLFSVYVGFLIAFTHVHIVNGVTIVHSHPYQKSNGEPLEHEHNYAEFQLLHQLSSIEIGGAVCTLILLTALCKEVFQNKVTLEVFFQKTPFLHAFSQRGPPFLVL
ncbi:MAG: hypothetical protein LUG98_05230 [Tannerellaceae bacterium]|nr:hypothetical protein [Tannerellaceae bacterium]